MFPVESLHHRLLLNPQKGAVRHCCCRSHAEWLTCEATFTEKVAVTQYAYGCFLANVGYDSESNLAFLDIKHCVGCIPLREDCLFLKKEHDFPALADSGKEFLGIEGGLFLRRRCWCHQWLLLAGSYTLMNYARMSCTEECSLLLIIGVYPKSVAAA